MLLSLTYYIWFLTSISGIRCSKTVTYWYYWSWMGCSRLAAPRQRLARGPANLSLSASFTQAAPRSARKAALLSAYLARRVR